MKSFKAESKKILDMMINSIYTHKEIFMRELLSNCSDAIDKLYYKSLVGGLSGLNREDFYITVVADKEARTLRISDNGIGMTADELDKDLGTIAKSGSLDFKKDAEAKEDLGIIGQFGVGFYSAFMVADKIEVLSKAYGSDEANLWISSGASGYEIKPAEKAERGTTVTLYLKKNAEEEHYDDFLSEYSLKGLIKKYSDYIRYPIKLLFHKEHYDGENKGEKYEEWETVNSMVPLWKKNKNDIKKEEYDSFYHDMFYDSEAPARVIHTSAEGTVDFKALLFIPSKAPYNFYTRAYEKGLRLYTNGVLITDLCKELLPDCFSFVKGVVDSELTLNVSRETIQESRQLKAIARNIEKKIKSELSDMLINDRETYEKFWAAFGMQIKYGVYADFGGSRELLEELILFRSIKEGKYLTFSEYVAAMGEEQKYIYYATGKSVDSIKALPQCEKVAEKGYDILCLTDDIDEFALRMLNEYKEKEFRSIAAEDVGFFDETSYENKELAEHIAGLLKDRVSKVKITEALKNNPVCFSTEGGLSIEMEKVLSSMPNAQPVKAEKVLEISANHPIFGKLKSLFESDKEKLGVYAEILYAQAQLIEGLPVDNPTELADKISRMLAD